MRAHAGLHAARGRGDQRLAHRGGTGLHSQGRHSARRQLQRQLPQPPAGLHPLIGRLAGVGPASTNQFLHAASNDGASVSHVAGG